MKNLLFFVAALCIVVTQITFAQTWVSLNGPQIASQVKDISVTTSGSTLYIADANHILKSTNSGTGWAVTPEPWSVPLLTLVRPDNGAVAFAARTGLLSHTTNGGGVWSDKINDTTLTPLRLAASLVNTNNMFLGRQYHSSTNSVWRSTTGGAIWAPSTNFTWETHIYDIAPYPVGDGTRNNWLWVSGSDLSGSAPESNPNATASVRGVWYSPDAGVTWQPRTMGEFNLRAIAVIHKASPANPHLYAGTASGSVYKSTNLGATWTSVFSGASGIRSIRVNTSNTNIFVAANNGVHRSTNEGTSWTQVLSGVDALSLAVYSLGNTVYAGTTGSLYKSTNNGSTWTNVGDMDVSSVTGAQIGSTQYAWAVTKDNNVAARHNGTSWERRTFGAEGTPFSAESIYRHPASGRLFAAGALRDTARLFSSTDNGVSYSQVSITNYTLRNGSRYYGVIADHNSSTTMYLFGGGTLSSGGTGWRNFFTSSDAGLNWHAPFGPVGTGNLWIHDLVALGDTLYAAASDGNVYTSLNKGTVWTVAVNVGNVARSITVNPAFPSVVYAGGSNGLWKYNGSTWSQIGATTITNVMKVMMHPSYQGSSDYLWVVSSGGTKVYKTTNGGSSWTDFSSGVTTPITSLGDDGVNKGYSYLGTAGGAYALDIPPAAPEGIMVTPTPQNRPRITWLRNKEADLRAGTPYELYKLPYYCYCQNGRLKCSGPGMGPGVDTLVYSGTDTTWVDPHVTLQSPQSCIGNEPPMLLKYYVLAIDKGGNLSRSSDSVTVFAGMGQTIEKNVPHQHVEGGLPEKFSVDHNYPNPFNPLTEIRYGLPEDAHVSLRVYDVLGREVAMLVDELRSAGYHAALLDGSTLASGVYFARFTATDASGVIRLARVSKLALMK